MCTFKPLGNLPENLVDTSCATSKPNLDESVMDNSATPAWLGEINESLQQLLDNQSAESKKSSRRYIISLVVALVGAIAALIAALPVLIQIFALLV